MTELTTKLADALRLISFASMDRGARDTAIEALRLYDEAKAWNERTGQFTADQMHAYAREAMAATPESQAPPAPAPAPLTDEQIDKTAKRVIPVAAYMGMFEYAAFSKEDADRTVRHFARAIEAALGIKVSTKESNQ